MKIFLDAWYPGSPAQLALDSNDQGDQGDEDWGNHTTVLAFFSLNRTIIWDRFLMVSTTSFKTMQEEDPANGECESLGPGPVHGDDLPIADMNVEATNLENDREDCESECEDVDDPLVDVPNAESPGPQSEVAETTMDTPDVPTTHEVPDETPKEAFEDGQGWWNTASPSPSPAPTAGKVMPSSTDPSTLETLPYVPDSLDINGSPSATASPGLSDIDERIAILKIFGF